MEAIALGHTVNLKHDLIVYAFQLNSSEIFFFSNSILSIKTLIIPITNTLFIERDWKYHNNYLVPVQNYEYLTQWYLLTGIFCYD